MEDKTIGDVLLAMVRTLMPESNPDRVFFEWLLANKHRLEKACAELGVKPPPEGKGYIRKLKCLVLPLLEK